MVSSLAGFAGEKDVWYNASGKVVMITPAQREKEYFIPPWEKRDAARNARRANRVRRTRSSYGYPYGAYGGYGWGVYPSYGHGYHHGHHGGYHGGYAPFYFHGTSKNSSWSVRGRF